MSSAVCFNLDQSKILSSGNGLNCEYTSVYVKNNNWKQKSAFFFKRNENNNERG